VTIFEAAAGRLFTSDAGIGAGNFVTIPNQAVDEMGHIAVPYAGEIVAKGRTPVEIQNDIVDRLKARALEPQVVVSVATQNTSLVSGVKAAGRFVASPSGESAFLTSSRAPADRLTKAMTFGYRWSERGIARAYRSAR
jgi:polysaccharide export outer membrane protein